MHTGEVVLCYQQQKNCLCGARSSQVIKDQCVAYINCSYTIAGNEQGILTVYS